MIVLLIGSVCTVTAAANLRAAVREKDGPGFVAGHTLLLVACVALTVFGTLATL